MNTEQLKEIAVKYGTPSFVFDEEKLKQRMRKIKEIVGDSISLCFSIKANPFLIPAMLEVTDKLEVCSPGELDICKALKVDAGRIIYSGVNKTFDNVIDAGEYKVGTYTAESVKHVALIQENGVRNNEKYDVLLRLNAGSQFGMSKEDIFACLEEKDKFDHINFVGIHYFAGTQRKKLKHQIEELSMLKDFFEEVNEKFGIKLERLEYGPGLYVPYFDSEDFSDTLSPVKELSLELKETAKWCSLTIEMGRFFVSECGYYLTKVVDMKNNKGINYLIIDGGMNHVNYLGQMLGMKNPIIEHIERDKDNDCDADVVEKYFGIEHTKASKNEEINYAVCGSLCTTSDVLVRQLPLINLQIGDILAFCNIGAYSVTEGIHLFLSRTMPQILLRKENGDIVIARGFMESSPINTIKG